MKKRPTKAAKAASKGNATPVTAKRRGGAAGAKKTPHQVWREKAVAGLWNAWGAWLGRQGFCPEAEERLRKILEDRLPKVLEEMAAAHAKKTEKWASMPPPSQALRQAAEAECDELAAAILQREAEQKDPKTHRTTQAIGRRALKALVLQDAGYSLAADVAGGDGQLEISLEALALWLQEAVEADGKRVPRWRTMPARSFRHHQRSSKYGWRESYIELNKAAGDWLWSGIGCAAFNDAEEGKALGYLLHRHQAAALQFLQRFLAARHSTQDKSRERLIDAAAAMEGGNKDRLGKTCKKDRDRIRREHKPAGE